MFIVRTVILWILISVSINAYLMTLPIPVLRKRDYPANYVIQQNNRIDFQNNTECAAFSTAYLLRHSFQRIDSVQCHDRVSHEFHNLCIEALECRVFLGCHR